MKILVAEDDLLIREGLVEILEGEGYTVVAAADGAAALELFDAEQPDVALLDIMMPELDGYEVCRQLVARSPSLPILFISARSEEIDHVIGLELGADDFITKPFGVREVVARIRAVMRRVQRARATATPHQLHNPGFRIGDLEVSPAELRARRDDRVIDLSLREVNILRVLHREAGRVVTRDQLFDECWGMSYLPNSRTLDQHISRLRKRVERDPRSPALIQTVHGVGYRYDGDAAP